MLMTTLTMLQTYRTRLLGACVVFNRDPLDICQLTEAQRWLRRVDGVLNGGGEIESARGIWGSNGPGPAIDLLCRMAEERAVSSRRAAA